MDLVINESSANLMSTNSYFVRREVSGSDKASFCGIYGSWEERQAAEE